MNRPTVVRGPWSRRRVVAWTGAAAGVLGALKLALWAAARDGAAPVDDAPPRALPTAVRPITLALPTSGDGVVAYHAELLAGALRRVVPDVNRVAAGAFAIEILEIEQPPFGQYRPQAHVLAPLIGSGAPPDLLLFTGSWSPSSIQGELASAASLRWLNPLDSYVRQDRTFRLGDFYAPLLDACREGGELIGLPLQSVVGVLVYDAPRILDAGGDLPGPQWDWRRVADAARRLTRDTDGDGEADEYGLYMGGAAGQLLSLIWQNGGEVISADKRSSRLGEPAVRGAVEFYRELYAAPRGALPAPPAFSWQWGPEGMRVKDRWWVDMAYTTLGAFRDVRGGAMAATELPTGKKRASAAGVRASLALCNKSRQRDQAAAAALATADSVSRTVDHPARRLSAAAIESLDPHADPPLAPAAISGLARTVVNTLEYGRTLVLDDMARTQQLHNTVSAFAVGLQSGIQRPGVLERLDADVQGLLNRSQSGLQSARS